MNISRCQNDVEAHKRSLNRKLKYGISKINNGITFFSQNDIEYLQNISTMAFFIWKLIGIVD